MSGIKNSTNRVSFCFDKGTEKLCIDSDSNGVNIKPHTESQNKSLSINNDGSVIAYNSIRTGHDGNIEATSVKKGSDLDTILNTGIANNRLTATFINDSKSITYELSSIKNRLIYRSGNFNSVQDKFPDASTIVNNKSTIGDTFKVCIVNEASSSLKIIKNNGQTLKGILSISPNEKKTFCVTITGINPDPKVTIIGLGTYI